MKFFFKLVSMNDEKILPSRWILENSKSKQIFLRNNHNSLQIQISASKPSFKIIRTKLAHIGVTYYYCTHSFARKFSWNIAKAIDSGPNSQKKQFRKDGNVSKAKFNVFGNFSNTVGPDGPCGVQIYWWFFKISLVYLEPKHLRLSNIITCKPLPQYHWQGIHPNRLLPEIFL